MQEFVLDIFQTPPPPSLQNNAPSIKRSWKRVRIQQSEVYLHCKRFAAASLTVGKDTHIIPINAGHDQGLDFLENLQNTRKSHVYKKKIKICLFHSKLLAADEKREIPATF